MSFNLVDANNHSDKDKFQLMRVLNNYDSFYFQINYIILLLIVIYFS